MRPVPDLRRWGGDVDEWQFSPSLGYDVDDNEDGGRKLNPFKKKKKKHARLYVRKEKKKEASPQWPAISAMTSSEESVRCCRSCPDLDFLFHWLSRARADSLK